MLHPLGAFGALILMPPCGSLVPPDDLELATVLTLSYDDLHT